MMKVHRTYDGRSFDINQPLAHFQSKEDLFDAISLTTGIPSDDIICMTKVGQQINEDVLEEMQETGAHGIEEVEFFVFHRQFLYSDLEALVVDLEEVPELESPLEEIESVHPPTPRSLEGLVDWCSVLLSNMTIHENHSLERLEQLSIIQRSTGIALSNLLSHSNSVRETARSLDESATKELNRMRGLLNGHETDLKILSLVQINPKLLTVPDSAKINKPRERTLGDYVSPSKMGAVYQACSNVQTDLEGNLKSLTFNGSQLSDDTEGLRKEVEMTNISPSQETFEESRQAMERAKEVHEFILANCLPDDQGWSAAAKLANDENLMKSIDEAMGELILLDEVIRESLRRLTADKNEMMSRSLHLLGDISSLQSDYADFGIEISQLDGEFKSNRIDGFRHLARLKNMLWAYGSTLIEIQRRKEFENKFLLRSQGLAEVMANLSESERRKRMEFRSQVMGALPWEVKGMDDSTPSLEISAGNGRGEDDIDIGKADVEELFRTLDFVEGKLLEGSTSTPINEVKMALQQLINRLDEAEGEFTRLVEVGLLGKAEEDSDSDEGSPTRPDKVKNNGYGSRGERERLEKEVQELKMHQGERERALAEAHDQELSMIRAELSKLKADNRQLEHNFEHERGQHEETKKMLESRIADAEVEAARRINMEEEVSKLRRDVESARRAEVDSKVEASEEVERANDLEAHLHDLQVELEEAKDARTDACNRIEALLNQDSSAEKQLSLAQERIDELSDQLSQARIDERKARDAQYEIETARDKTLRNYRAEADGDRAILEETLRGQSVELQEAKENLQKKEKEVGEYSENAKNLQGQLTAADEAHEELVRQLESNREAKMDVEMAKRHADRSLEAMVERIRPLMTKLIELHNAFRDMAPLYSSSRNGTRSIKEVPAEEVVDAEVEAQKQRAIDAFQVSSDTATGESILELVNCLTRISLLDKVITKLEVLPPLCKRYGKGYKHFKDQAGKMEILLKDKISFRNFTIGDLALFLPTRNNSGKPWAAFNINFPHYFLNFSGNKENELLKESLQNKEWIVARITKIESKVASGSKDGETEIEGNPFQLAEGVKFYLLDVEGWNNANSNVAPLARRKSSSVAIKSVNNSTAGNSNNAANNVAEVPVLKRWDTSPSLKRKESSTGEGGTARLAIEEGDDIDEFVGAASPIVSPERPRATSSAALQVLSTSSPVATTRLTEQAMTLSRACSPSGIALSLRNRSASPEVQRNSSTRNRIDNVDTGFTPWPLTGAANESSTHASSSKTDPTIENNRKITGIENAAPAFGRRKKLGLGLASASGGYGTAMLQSRSAGGPLSPPLAQAKQSQQIMPISVADRSSAATMSGNDNKVDSAPNPFSASPATGSGMTEMRDYFGSGGGGERHRTSSRLRPADTPSFKNTDIKEKGKEEERENTTLQARIRRESSSSTVSSFRGVSILASPGVRAIPTLSPSIEVAQGHNSYGHQVVDDERALSSTSQGSETSSSANRSGLSFTRTLPRNTSTRRLPSSASNSSWTGNWTLGRRSGSKTAEQAKGEDGNGNGMLEEGQFNSSSASQSLRRLADGKLP